MNGELMLIALAISLADSAAISDIECCCEEWSDSSRERRWYDTTFLVGIALEDSSFIATALRYLELRCILIRKPEHPHVVGFDRSRIAEVPA